MSDMTVLHVGDREIKIASDQITDPTLEVLEALGEAAETQSILATVRLPKLVGVNTDGWRQSDLLKFADAYAKAYEEAAELSVPEASGSAD
ncbi:hypothetical protein RFH55_03690 [Cutibacterium avidum]|uniref:hypothetical protein n=2 Tax=Cutibacterium avidum TaxID=33010 RepID=UPI0024306058|nr:hypothetical protein [Cutibacterium avidum]MDQ9074653.1 hypothetical protein [Cutibacterium avidum]MDU4679081.1 hypothetical protein [Cutibacterium avidum]MDU5547356.1 hypothetical protein [Cutibacterium avidum]